MASHNSKFPGFPETLEKSFWQFPAIINGYVRTLTGAEFKVLWYILRHTYGWQKNSDRLSITQICEGIKRRDGTYLDKGTGLSRKWAVNTLHGLEEKGFIVIKRKRGRVNLIYPRMTSVENTLVPTEQSTLAASVESTPTINTIPIKNNNNFPARQENKNSYKKEISYLTSYLGKKLGGVSFPNGGKQAKFIKLMLTDGYTVENICWAVDKLYTNEWWRNNGFDMKNVADQIPKLIAGNKKTQRDLSKPTFNPCNQNGCDGGYIESINHGRFTECQCFLMYKQEYKEWEEKWNLV